MLSKCYENTYYYAAIRMEMALEAHYPRSVVAEFFLVISWLSIYENNRNRIKSKQYKLERQQTFTYILAVSSC